MDYIKIRLGGAIDGPPQRFDKNMEEMLRVLNPRFSCGECSWTPPMDIIETPEEIVIFAEVAGVKKKDLDIEINSKAMRISGSRQGIPPGGYGRATYLLAEIQCGVFERVLYLPKPVNTEKVSASYDDGMLRIRLKKLPVETSHKVTISD